MFNGFAAGNFFVLGKNTIFDVKKAKAFNVNNIGQLQEIAQTDNSLTKNVEIIYGLDEEIIKLDLADFNGSNPSYAGFLVEVFMSTSSGFQKVYRKDVIDEKTGQVGLEGFEKYFYLKEE